ncbi:unnamed protein product [Sympodiomycopsis kandeliae]
MSTSAQVSNTTSDQKPSTSSSSSAEKQPETISPAPSITSTDLERLHSQLYLFRPQTSTLPKSKTPSLTQFLSKHADDAQISPPRTILLLGWMDAPLKLLLKYVQPYHEMFPFANIVIQLSNGKSYLQGSKNESLSTLSRFLLDDKSKEEERKAMRMEMMSIENKSESLTLDNDHKSTSSPVLDDSTISLIDKKEGQEESTEDLSKGASDKLKLNPIPSGVLIHTFSDGGSSNLHFLLNQLKTHSTSPAIRATIFDSSPSAGTPIPGATAFTMPLMKSNWWIVRIVIRRLVKSFLIVYLYLVWVVKRTIGKKSRHDVFRQSLNNPKSWSRASSAGLPPRLYLYSKADALVPYKAVEEHARTAANQSADGNLDLVDVEKSHSDDSQAKSDRIRLRRWTKAPHCSMARVDPERYWKEVSHFLQHSLK